MVPDPENIGFDIKFVVLAIFYQSQKDILLMVAILANRPIFQARHAKVNSTINV